MSSQSKSSSGIQLILIGIILLSSFRECACKGVNESQCAPKVPKVTFGLRGSIANMFVANEAYANFLFKEFNISTADEESAAVVLTALSNAVPCIVFRGISDVAGGDKLALAGLSSLATIKAFKVVVEFMVVISEKRHPLINVVKTDQLLISTPCT